jgi:hypothetical protein
VNKVANSLGDKTYWGYSVQVPEFRVQLLTSGDFTRLEAFLVFILVFCVAACQQQQNKKYTYNIANAKKGIVTKGEGAVGKKNNN